MRYAMLISLLVLNACGQPVTTVSGASAAPSSCSAVTINGQNEVSCTDGTSFVVSNGVNGTNGENGYSIGSLSLPATSNQCANGGQVLEFYEDVNYSGVYASNDPITSQVTICNGLNGQNGSNGLNGSNGTNGTNGVNGTNGQNGTSSSVSVSQASQSQCSNGGLAITTLTGSQSSTSVVCNGATGPQGQQGPQGLTGVTGAQGISGISPSVSAVQFCPNYAASYPNVFPEFGLCLNNAIYAVYWDNKNAWLSEVVPGYYSSTSTSAPCNFTVTSGCNISN